MAKRIGKYKVSKREETLSAVDGATIEGSLDGITNLTATGTSTLTTAVIGTGGVASTGEIRLTGCAAPANSVAAVCNGVAVAADGAGIYEVIFETDFGGYTATATDNGLIKTAITIPTDSMIIAASTIVTEVVGQNNTSTIDLVSATTAGSDTADEAVSAVLTIIDGLDFKSSGAGALGALGAPVYANDIVHHIGSTGTSTTLCWINKGTGNGTAAYVSGKILTYIKYMGTGPASADTRV
jgi:hypothetical protein